MGKNVRYEVTAAGDFASVLAVLTDHLKLRVLSIETVERCWLDTAAATLEGADTMLEYRLPVAEGSPSLSWSAAGRMLAHDACVSATLPVGASDLPDSWSFERLTGLLGPDRLLASTKVNSQIALLASLDDEQKTTARVTLDSSQRPDGYLLPMVLEIFPLRGYETEAATLEQRVQEKIALFPSDLSVKDRVLNDTTSETSTGLRTSLSAASAWRDALQRLTETMTASFAGVLSGDDPKNLHDFRVAVRRTRTLLQDGAEVIDPESRDRFRHEYRWLGDITTPTRDADVLSFEFPKLAGAVSNSRDVDLTSFLDVLERHRANCHTEMVTELRSLRRAEFGIAWLEFLADDDAWTGCGELAEAPVVSVLTKRVERAHHQLIRNGKKISKKSPAISLHELRKEGKRLRYLLECFGPLYNQDAYHTVVEPLRELQNVLGEFQDTEVQATAVLHLAAKLVDGPTDTSYAAVEAVAERLAVRAVRARSQFAQVFGQFDTRKIERAFLQLTEPSSTSTKSKRKSKDTSSAKSARKKKR
ncbi:MAG: CHAD domain-containing protein [Acidimicrobiales bacterium]